MNKGLHPKPWYKEENHDDVPERIAKSTGVAAVDAKARSFHSEAHPSHHEPPGITVTSRSLQVRIWALPLSMQESQP
jgi:hypothetical protein